MSQVWLVPEGLDGERVDSAAARITPAATIASPAIQAHCFRGESSDSAAAGPGSSSASRPVSTFGSRLVNQR